MPSRKIKISEDENQKPLFFDSIHIKEIPVNNTLPSPQIKSIITNSSGIIVKTEVPTLDSLVTVYIYINAEKRDMFYQVKPGIVSFKITTTASDNLLELFYLKGNTKSPSVFSFIKGEK